MVSTVRALAVLCLTAIAWAAPAAAQGQRPASLLLDRAYISEVRARGAQGRCGDRGRDRRARGRGEAGAGRAADVGDGQQVTPPSGDRHDYMSQAPYWWPDPSRPDGLPYIRKDGERNPEISRITDRDNLGRLGGAVTTLSLAYAYTGHEVYATHAARLVRGWFLAPAMRMNPHLQYGQYIRGINKGRGIGIIETRNLPELLDGVLLLSTSPAWTKADEEGLQAWMRAYLTWLLESTHGREEAKNGNNHRRPGTTSRSRAWRSTRDRSIWFDGRSTVPVPASPARSNRTVASRASSNGRARGTTATSTLPRS